MMDKDFYELVNTGKKHSNDNWGTGVILQHPHTKKILLAKRTDTHEFASPGGKVEYSESPKQGILRECKEESNVKINNMICYDFRTHSSPNGKNWVDFLFYSNDFDDSSIQNQETEMEEFNWYSVEEALQLPMFPPTKASLERAVELGLTGAVEPDNYVSYLDMPTSASSASVAHDSCPCSYSYEEPEQIFTTHQLMPWD